MCCGNEFKKGCPKCYARKGNQEVCITTETGGFKYIYIGNSEGMIYITQNSYTMLVEQSQVKVFINTLNNIMKGKNNIQICIPSVIGECREIYIESSEGMIYITQNLHTMVVEPSQEKMFINILNIISSKKDTMTLIQLEDMLFNMTTGENPKYDIKDLEDIWRKSRIDNDNITDLFKKINKRPKDRLKRQHTSISIMEFIELTPRLKEKLRNSLSEERKMRNSHSQGHGC